jgi:hypothetical protein
MKLKTLIVTIAVLAALSVIAFVARRPAPPAAGDSRLNQPLVDPATVEKAAGLRISDQGRTVTITRQTDGGWSVPSYHDLPADFAKLSGFIGGLAEAKVQRLVTSSPERIARLEFKDTRIDLLDAAGATLVAITLGRHPETGGGRFVRYGEENKAYLANLNAWLDSEPRNWANAEFLQVKADDVARLEVPLETGAVTLSRAKKDDPWTADPTPTNQRLRAEKIAGLLASLGTLRFSDTTATDDANAVAARANLRSIKLTTFDQKTITVALGRKPEEKKLKPPSADADGKAGPGALGTVSDLAKKEGDPKPLGPEFETIPAGPVFAFVTHSDTAAPINTWMQKRAFQIADSPFTSLPQKTDDLFEPVPAPAPATP